MPVVPSYPWYGYSRNFEHMAMSMLLTGQILHMGFTTERFGPGPVWAQAHWAQGPLGPGMPRARLSPGPVWAQGSFGPRARLGPGTIWDQPRLGPGPIWAQGPFGRAARLGPGPI